MITSDIKSTFSWIVETCPIWTTPTPASPDATQIRPIQIGGPYPVQDWQIDVPFLSKVLGNFKHRLVLVDTFSMRTGSFPARTETAAEGAKVLLKEIIPRFGLPGSLQSNKDLAFVSQLTKGVMSALDRKWTFHSAWKLHSLRGGREIQLDLNHTISGNSRKLDLNSFYCPAPHTVSPKG